MTNRARIAVIGTGWWSTYTHIPGLLEYADTDLVALCDSNPERLLAASKAYHIARTYTDYHEMLRNEKLDGVIIATSHASHFEVARACLEHNLHVMIEKPMTLYAREAKQLVELARERNREIVVGYTYHFTPHAIRVREVIHSGALGAVQFVSCVFTSHILGLLQGTDGSEHSSPQFPVHGPGNVYSQPHLSGGGEGHLQVTHSAGLMFFVTGLRARRVHALMRNHGLALDLVDSMTVEFEGEGIGSVGGCGNTAGSRGKFDLLIFCQNGSVEMDLLEGSTTIYRQNAAREDFPAHPDNNPRFATARNLADVILGRATNGSPGDVGWRTVELLDAAYQSALRDGQAIFIEDLYE